MVFNINEYITKAGAYGTKYAMMCADQEEARVFCQYLHDQGKTWSNGDSYLSVNHSFTDRPTCYDFITGMYGSLSQCENIGYEILYFSDFIWDNCDDNLEISSEDISLLNEFLSSFNS